MLNPDPGLVAAFIQQWREWVKPVCDLSMFPYAYVGNGSSELIRDVVNSHALAGERYFYTLPGEYEGFGHYVKAAGKGVMPTLNTPHALLPDREGVAYVSNPSAIDGNWFNPATDIGGLGRNKVLLDLAYINTAYNQSAYVSYADSVFFSASKSLGMFYYRTGLVFTKREMTGLIGNNLWFHNPMSIRAVMAVLNAYPCGWLWEQMRMHQSDALSYYFRNGYSMAQSDSFLLAQWNGMSGPADYRRAKDQYRYCLYPYYEEHVK